MTRVIDQWKRSDQNPVFPVVPGTWKEAWTANPDILRVDDTYLFYYRGQKEDHDRIGIMTAPVDQFDGKTFDDYEGNPIIDIGPEGSFDHDYVLDPSAVLREDGDIYMYYSGIGAYEDSVGLAISHDGFHFEKYEGNPLWVGRAPEVVFHEGLYYLLYVKNQDSGYFVRTPFAIYLATSEDGIHFDKYQEEPVLQGDADSWDVQSTTTPRILKEGDTYYMVYAGDDQHADYFKYFGLARSKDLVSWEKCPQNPIFSRGEAGAWDEGGIWFGTCINHNGVYYLWYEGYGGGRDRDTAFDEGGRSQIGLATLSGVRFADLFT